LGGWGSLKMVNLFTGGQVSASLFLAPRMAEDSSSLRILDVAILVARHL
jgi:hypothetical protein